jgi:hypothetical protein
MMAPLISFVGPAKRRAAYMVQPMSAQPADATMETMEDFLTREYLSVIGQFPEKDLQNSLLRESVVTLVRIKDASKKPPSAPVSDHLPDELAFLEGPLADLGFGKLNLPQAEIERILLAFCGEGVAVPGTPSKLRHSVMSLFTFVGPASGREVMLPADWREVVRSHSWIGKKAVTPDVDLSTYENVGDGYLLRKDNQGS